MMHVLINALSMGSGGGFTVGRELLRNLGAARPDWKLTFAIIAEHPLHQQIRNFPLPPNVSLFEAPASSAPRRARQHWERSQLTKWAEKNAVDVVVQLNGMLVPGMKPPTLCHMQDPWPYRPMAWRGMKDRLIAFLKRRQHRRSLQHAAAVSWTSEYLQKLICDYHRITPANSRVLHNGVPAEWIPRVSQPFVPLTERPLEILTVSNVNFYKRQELVIRALPQILKHPGLESLKYRVVGAIDSPALREHLEQVARSLGVHDHVIFEGRVSDQRVIEVFSSARAFVLMSVCESFGIPAMESMTFGTPVVTSDCCAMPEVCGLAAQLVPPDDVNATAEQIIRVLTDPKLTEALQVRGAARVVRFNWRFTAQHLADLLEQMLNNGVDAAELGDAASA